MAIDDLAAAYNIKIDDPQSSKKSSHDFSLNERDMEEIRCAMEDLTEVDLGLAYSSEKLVNLDNLLMHLLACENDFDYTSIEDDNFPPAFIEKALTVDLLHAILNTEVKELDNFNSSLQVSTVGARDKIFSCEKSIELYDVVGSKLHDSEESLRELHERIIEMKMQLAKLQMTSLTLNQSEWRYNTKIGLSEGVNLKPQMHTVDKRQVLRMLEKSLARELDLEKKSSELKQNEEDLKLKLHLTEQVALCMEETAEVTWARFLEAENTVEILMGVSKEMVGKLQTVQFYLNGSVTREQELKTKLQECSKQLNGKEIVIQEVNNRVAQLVADNSEVSSLRENVILLENKLKESEFRVKEANACNEASEERLRETEAAIESLTDNINAAESKVQEAESKITQLTDANAELTEELNFLKGRNDRNTEKMSVIEKQLRESEQQLQHARASSEASQEQQNMLYSAIWDMETLIDELRQKVSESENKIENSEEQRIFLTGTNLELNKELDFVRAQVEALETSLNQAAVEKIASAKDINIKSNLIMDMIVQLALERERIQKQLYLLQKENKILKVKSVKAKNYSSSNLLDDGGTTKGELLPPESDSRNAAFVETAAESSPIFSPVEESSSIASANKTEIMASAFRDDSNNMVLKVEAEGQVGTGKHRRMYIFTAVIMLLVSILAACFFDKKHVISKYFST